MSKTYNDPVKSKVRDKFDLILCTGGIHHLQYDKQEPFIRKIHGLLNDKGLAITADPLIADYWDEEQRRIAAAELGCAYLEATILRGGDRDMQQACFDIMWNDVFGHEYKTSFKIMSAMMNRVFSKVESHKTWPAACYPPGYGDHYFLLRK